MRSAIPHVSVKTRDPVTSETPNRRGDLVRAAAQLFREKGFDGTTIRDIARAVGMQSGSPFYHFANKHELLMAVMEEGLRQGLERAHAVLDDDGAAADAAFRAPRAHALRHPARHRQRLRSGDALRLALAAGDRTGAASSR